MLGSLGGVTYRSEATGAGGLWARSVEEGTEGELPWSACLSAVALAKANSEPPGVRSGPPSGRFLGQNSSLALIRARPQGRDCPRARAQHGGAPTCHCRVFQWVQLLLPAVQDRPGVTSQGRLGVDNRSSKAIPSHLSGTSPFPSLRKWKTRVSQEPCPGSRALSLQYVPLGVQPCFHYERN